AAARVGRRGGCSGRPLQSVLAGRTPPAIPARRPSTAAGWAAGLQPGFVRTRGCVADRSPPHPKPPMRTCQPMIRNIAAYHFVEIADPQALAGRVREWAESGGLRGTVLVAPEGINL